MARFIPDEEIVNYIKYMRNFIPEKGIEFFLKKGLKYK